jgi:RNA polymerase sigma factor (sigma-70 family)
VNINDETIIEMLNNEQAREKGFRMLMSKYQEKLYRQAKNILKNHEDADDALQNALIKVFRGIHLFEGRSLFSTWLYRIVVNESLTIAQSRQKRATVDEPELALANHESKGLDPDPNMIQQYLQEAMDRLPEKQKAVFGLRYYEEMPYEQMSQVLSTSEGALKASYHHAVKKIEDYVRSKA